MESNGLWQHLVYLVTQGHLAFSFWLAALWLILLLSRRSVLGAAWQWLGVKDDQLKKELTHKLELPLSILLLLLAVLPFVRLMAGDIGQVMEKVALFVSAFLVFHLMIQSLDLFVVRWYLGKVKDTSVSPAFHVLLFSILYLSVLLLLMDVVLNINVLPLLATSTVATAVLGLALQDTLKNIFAGLTISMEKSFRHGDWVLFPASNGKDVIGQIVEIGWRCTKMCTGNNNYLIVPNGQFVSQQLINLSFPNKSHALNFEIPVSREFTPKAVSEAMLAGISSVDEILPEPKPSVVASKMGSQEVTYRIEYFTDKVQERDRLNNLAIQAVWQQLAKMGAITPE